MEATRSTSAMSESADCPEGDPRFQAGTASAQLPPRIIYIAGYGRSGSSVLGVLLGAHPDIFNAGALGQATAMLRDGATCTCGATLLACSFWSAGIRGIPTHETDRQGSTGRLAEFAARRSGARFIVDGSKSTYHYAARPFRYLQSGKEVYIIHLIRHPAAVLRSALKGQNSRLERGVVVGPVSRPLERLRTLWGWFHANLIASFYRWKYPDKSMRVDYENLCRQPHTELARIGALIGVNLGIVAGRIDRAEAFEVGHELAGNRILRSGSIVFRSDSQEATIAGFWSAVGSAVGALFGTGSRQRKR